MSTYMETNWIENGARALEKFKESGVSEGKDLETLANFVEQALVKTTWNGETEPLSQEGWVVYFGGATRRYKTLEKAEAECERIYAVDIPRQEAAGWFLGIPVPIIEHEVRSTLKPFIESIETLDRRVYARKEQVG